MMTPTPTAGRRDVVHYALHPPAECAISYHTAALELSAICDAMRAQRAAVTIPGVLNQTIRTEYGCQQSLPLRSHICSSKNRLLTRLELLPRGGTVQHRVGLVLDARQMTAACKTAMAQHVPDAGTVQQLTNNIQCTSNARSVFFGRASFMQCTQRKRSVPANTGHINSILCECHVLRC